jgi:hypothetical protein
MTEYLVKAVLPQSTYITYSPSQPANMMEKPTSHTVHLQLQMFETVIPVFKKEQTYDATKAHNTVTKIYIQQLTLVRQIVVHSSLTLYENSLATALAQEFLHQPIASNL